MLPIRLILVIDTCYSNSMNRKSSFTLIEVMIFVTVVSLFFVVAAAVTTYSLRNMKTSQNKLLAAHYSSELVEWVRGQKESNSEGWAGFINNVGTIGASTTYCFTSVTNGTTWPTSTSSTGNSKSVCGNGNVMGTPAIFKRELLLRNVDGFQVDVTVTTSWPEVGGVTMSDVQKTRVSLWEKK